MLTTLANCWNISYQNPQLPHPSHWITSYQSEIVCESEWLGKLGHLPCQINSYLCDVEYDLFLQGTIMNQHCDTCLKTCFDLTSDPSQFNFDVSQQLLLCSQYNTVYTVTHFCCNLFQCQIILTNPAAFGFQQPRNLMKFSFIFTHYTSERWIFTSNLSVRINFVLFHTRNLVYTQLKSMTQTLLLTKMYQVRPVTWNSWNTVFILFCSIIFSVCNYRRICNT